MYMHPWLLYNFKRIQLNYENFNILSNQSDDDEDDDEDEDELEDMEEDEDIEEDEEEEEKKQAWVKQKMKDAKEGR